MKYWRGYMDWPLAAGWVCEICGKYKGLTWGIVHAQCRCNACHAEYTMRDEQGEVVETPISLIKDEYRQPAIEGFKRFEIPISQFTDLQWDRLIGECSAGSSGD